MYFFEGVEKMEQKKNVRNTAQRNQSRARKVHKHKSKSRMSLIKDEWTVR